MANEDTQKVETVEAEPGADAEKVRAELAAAEAALEEARAALEQTRRRAVLERELARAQAIDPEVAMLLCEGAAKGAGAFDAGGLVADLKKRKPYLFKAPAPTPRATSSAAHHSGTSELEQVAEEARASGDRRALMHYLRVRRGQ